jgi:hypothetical protein
MILLIAVVSGSLENGCEHSFVKSRTHQLIIEARRPQFIA